MNLTLTTTGYPYPPSFFMPQAVDLDIEDNQWEIREMIMEYLRNEQYPDAVKLCIKLFVNSVATPLDLKSLNSMVYKQIDNLAFEQGDALKLSLNDYNFIEIQTILSSCDKAVYHTMQETCKNDLLIQHLNSKTTDLAETIEKITKNALLLLKSKDDQGSNLALLPNDVLQYITTKCLAIVTDINQTPVDISSAEPFPI